MSEIVSTAENNLDNKNLRLSFRFQPHSSEDVSKDDLEKMMLGVFHKGERNILFLEDTSKSLEFSRQKVWDEAFNHFKGQKDCYMKSYLGSLNPNREDWDKPDFLEVALTEVSEILDEAPTNTKDSTNYILENLRALDSIDPDYKVEIMFEDSEYDPNTQPDNFSTTGEQGSILDAIINLVYHRNEHIVEQLEQLRKSTRQKTNALVILGTNHSPILSQLPDNLKDNILVASSQLDKPTEGFEGDIKRAFAAGFSNPISEGVHAKAEANKRDKSEVKGGRFSRMMARFRKK